MNDRQKSILALIIVFIALLLMGILEAYLKAATPEVPLPETVTQQVDQALKYRDGVVLWWDQKTGARKIYGNSLLLQENFLPGSLMKLITAEAAVTRGVQMSYRCEGHDTWQGRRRNCWTPEGHGRLDLPQALGVSCNLFFSKLGLKLGFQPILNTLQEYALGKERTLKVQDLDLIDFAVGDDPNFQVTPQQMANFWNQYLDKLALPRFQAIRQGLLRAAQDGTARAAATDGVTLLAKTGTADSRVTAYKTHGWFLGAYPAENPRYRLLIFLKNAHGYLEPAQLAGQILKLHHENQ